MTAAETSGWSPSATRTAPASGPIASNPTCSELDRPRSGSGIDDPARAPPARWRPRSRSASCPRTTTDSPIPASARASRTCWRTGRPPIVAEQLAATEARSRPGGEDESHGPLGHIGIFPPPCGQSSLAAVEADHPRGRPPMRRESVTDDHRARPDARRRPARSAATEADSGAGTEPPPSRRSTSGRQLACRSRARRRDHRPAREPGRRMDVRLRRPDPDRRRAWSLRHRLCLVRSRGGSPDLRAARPDPGRRHDLGRARHPVTWPRSCSTWTTWTPTAASSGLILTLGLGYRRRRPLLRGDAVVDRRTGRALDGGAGRGDRATRLVLHRAAASSSSAGSATSPSAIWFLRAGVEVITLHPAGGPRHARGGRPGRAAAAPAPAGVRRARTFDRRGDHRPPAHVGSSSARGRGSTDWLASCSTSRAWSSSSSARASPSSRGRTRDDRRPDRSDARPPDRAQAGRWPGARSRIGAPVPP